jgi:thiol-disulfide isomerase/thioredoxin
MRNHEWRWVKRSVLGSAWVLLPMLAARAQPTAVALLRGTIAHAPARSLRLFHSLSPVEMRHDTTIVRVAANGDFSARIPLAAAGDATLQLGRHDWPLWLSPGDTLTLHLDARHLRRPPVLSGPTAALNYYRAAQLRAHTDNFYDAPEGRRDARTPATRRQRADAYRRRAEAVLQQSQARHPLSPAYYRREQQAIAYEWGAVLLLYPYDYEYEQPARKRVVRVLPEAYFDFVRELPLPQDSLLPDRRYQQYIGLYPQYWRRAARRHLTFAENISRQFAHAYDTVSATFPPGSTRNYVLAQQLGQLLRLGPAAEVAPRLADFQARSVAPELQAAVARAAVRYQRRASGQPLPPFQLLNEAGQPADLASLRGKVVYLDFWASWCKPCRAEQPALRALRQQFAGRAEVAFVGISIDARAADWHRALVQEPAAAGPLAPQLQLIGQPGDAALRRLLEEGGVPQYWLLGADGRILNSHACRPSHPGAPAAIEEAIRTTKAKATGD